MNTEIYSMEHFEENYGFLIKEKNHPILSYISDTVWCKNIETILKQQPKNIIVDLNGEPDDPVHVHLCENEIISKGFELSGSESVFHGTHLKKQKTSSHKNIIYTYPGMEIKI